MWGQARLWGVDVPAWPHGSATCSTQLHLGGFRQVSGRACSGHTQPRPAPPHAPQGAGMHGTLHLGHHLGCPPPQHAPVWGAQPTGSHGALTQHPEKPPLCHLSSEQSLPPSAGPWLHTHHTPSRSTWLLVCGNTLTAHPGVGGFPNPSNTALTNSHRPYTPTPQDTHTHGWESHPWSCMAGRLSRVGLGQCCLLPPKHSVGTVGGTINRAGEVHSSKGLGPCRGSRAARAGRG